MYVCIYVYITVYIRFCTLKARNTDTNIATIRHNEYVYVYLVGVLQSIFNSFNNKLKTEIY